MNTKENSLKKFEEKRSLKYQENLIGESGFMAEHAALLAMAAMWNIRKHQLFTDEGHKNMKGYILAREMNYNSIMSALRKADHIANTVARDKANAEDFFLDHNHVKEYYQIAKQKRLEDKTSRKLLPINLEEFVEIDTDMESRFQAASFDKVAKQKNPTKKLSRKEASAETSVLNAKDIALGMRPFAINCDMLKEQFDEFRYYIRLIIWQMQNIPRLIEIASNKLPTYEQACALRDTYYATPQKLPAYVLFALGSDTF
jgi:hypothetical protein